MSAARRHLARFFVLFALMWFFHPGGGWVVYPGWCSEWYSTIPQNYAWPASLSNPADPRWGFWFW